LGAAANLDVDKRLIHKPMAPLSFDSKVMGLGMSKSIKIILFGN
jgi:hypothetical protein